VYLGIALTAFVFAMLPICLAYPWIGMLMWAWLGYMTPHRLTWHFSSQMHFAVLVAVATLVGLLFTKDRKPIPWVRETYLLSALWLLFTLSTVVALYPDHAWPRWYFISKILLFTYVPLLLLQDRKRLKWFLLVIALSIGFYGLKGGIWSIGKGGAGTVEMPDGTMFTGTNGAALALNMVLPMLFYLAREEENQWLRRLLRATFVFSIVAVLFTYSRGGLVGLCALLLVLAAKSGKLLRATVALAAAYVLVMNFAPPQWFARMDTIRTYEEDSSARARLDAWYMAYRLALDRPLLGGGLESIGQPEIVARYLPDRAGRGFEVTAHSIYFSLMGEHGFLGLGLFLALVASTVLTLRSLRRGRTRPSWVRSYSHMLEASLVAYLVTGAFLSVAYVDLFYHIVACVILLKVLSDRETKEDATAGEVGARVGKANHVRYSRVR
jgi:probable O-glycosylation ligase (exosortase A-associated)